MLKRYTYDRDYGGFEETSDGNMIYYDEIEPLIEAVMEIYAKHNEAYQNHIVRCRCGLCDAFRKMEEIDGLHGT